MEIPIIAIYNGGRASDHRLPAIEGAESILGFARGLQIIANFGVEGRVRHRAPYSELGRVELLPPRAGSFESLYNILVSNEALIWLAGTAASGVIGNAVYDLIKTALKRSVGEIHRPTTNEVAQLDRARTGDLDALIDAINPSLVAAHKAIGGGGQARQIAIVSGSNNVVNFNAQTKRYVTTTIKLPQQRRELSVASYNANSRYGRVFDFELGKTVSFTLSRDTDPESVSAIVTSLQRYAEDLPNAAIRATVLPNATVDNRVKHYRIASCTLLRP